MNNPEDLNPEEEIPGEKEIFSYRTKAFLNNVERFRPIIDKLIDKNVEIDLLCSDFKMASLTLQNRLSSVLKYLATIKTTGKFDITDYALLKARTKFCRSDDRVSIKFKKIVQFRGIDVDKFLHPAAKIISESGENAANFVKTKVLEFLADDSRKTLELKGAKDLGGCVLSAETIEWVRKTFIDGDIAFEVRADMIRAIKD